MEIDIITLFPGIFAGPLTESIIKRARGKGLVNIRIHNLRGYARDRHRTADDRPFGGGGGMVIKPEPVFDAVDALKREETVLLLMTPQGKKFSQSMAGELSVKPHLLFICGHYEGIDERIRTGLAPVEISIGDYILTNGSLPAAVVIDAVVRLIPGVLGNPDSVNRESFTDGLLEHPQYTRPREYRGMKVPGELLSGHHKRIEEWKRVQSLKRTVKNRPDMLGC